MFCVTSVETRGVHAIKPWLLVVTNCVGNGCLIESKLNHPVTIVNAVLFDSDGGVFPISIPSSTLGVGLHDAVGSAREGADVVGHGLSRVHTDSIARIRAVRKRLCDSLRIGTLARGGSTPVPLLISHCEKCNA